MDDRCETWAAVYDDEELYGDYFGEVAWDTLGRMAVSPTGDRVFALGLSRNDLFPFAVGRWALVATDAATGDQLWVAHRPWPTETLVDIAVSPDGRRVYLTGFRPGAERAGDGYPLFNTNVLTIAYDAATGQELWVRTFRAAPVGHRDGDDYDLHSGDAGLAVVASPTGDRVYVTGMSDATEGYYNVLALAYHAVTGEQKWVSLYDTATPDHPHARDVALAYLADVSPDGRTLYLAGSSCKSESSQDPCDYVTLAYQAHDPQDPARDGQRLWVRQAGSGSGSDAPTSIVAAPDGARLYVTGFLEESDDPTYATAALEAATGTQLWVSRGQGASDRWMSSAASPQGETVFVTGGSQVAAYNASTGEQHWVTSYEGGELNSVAVSPDGTRVYVTGASAVDVAAGVEPRQATVAYDAGTGEQVWVDRYQQMLDVSGGRFVEVGPDGTVFTAGDLGRVLVVGLGVGLVAFDPSLKGNASDWGIQAYEP